MLSCALVCRNWLPAARLCLLNTGVELRTIHQYDRFNADVLRSESRKPWLKHIQRLRVSSTLHSLVA